MVLAGGEPAGRSKVEPRVPNARSRITLYPVAPLGGAEPKSLVHGRGRRGSKGMGPLCESGILQPWGDTVTHPPWIARGSARSRRLRLSVVCRQALRTAPVGTTPVSR